MKDVPHNDGNTPNLLYGAVSDFFSHHGFSVDIGNKPIKLKKGETEPRVTITYEPLTGIARITVGHERNIGNLEDTPI